MYALFLLSACVNLRGTVGLIPPWAFVIVPSRTSPFLIGSFHSFPSWLWWVGNIRFENLKSLNLILPQPTCKLESS